MFNPNHFENSQSGGVAVMEILDETQSRERPLFVPLRGTHLEGHVTGPVANFKLTHTYSFAKEECSKPVEALYRFPLPGDAAVTAVAVQFGDVEITAELAEREEARRSYDEAIARGQQAALFTWETPDVFTLLVAGVKPDEEVTVQTTYVQLARPEGAGWSLRVPLTTAPRYVREDERGSRYAQGQPLAVFRDPGHRFSLKVTFDGAVNIASPTHELSFDHQLGGDVVELVDGLVLPDRDLVLNWQPENHVAAPALQVLAETDQDEGADYFLALVTPPAETPEVTLPREVLVLVDRSGSMHGVKWQAANWALKRFLSGLGESDWFNIGLFHDDTRWFSATPEPGTMDRVSDAFDFVAAHQDSGGTNLGAALEQALTQERGSGELVRHVLVITDAQVTDEARLLQLVEREAERPRRRRVSLLCIDAAPNSYLVQKLAERGGGTCRFLTSDPSQRDIATALDDLLAEWEQPVCAGLRLEVNRPRVTAAGANQMHASQPGRAALDLGDLTAGRTRWVVGRAASDAVDNRLTARVVDAGGNLLGELVASPAAPASVLRSVYAANRLATLEFLLHGRYSPDELEEQLGALGFDAQSVVAGSDSPLYSENRRRLMVGAVRKLLVKESLAVGLMCSETSFIARRMEAGERVAHTVPVGNALPGAWSEEFLTVRSYNRVMAKQLDPARLYTPARKSFSLPARAEREYRGPLESVTEFVSSQTDFERASECDPAAVGVQEVTVYRGVPDLSSGGKAILFDSKATGQPKLPATGHIGGLMVTFDGKTPRSADRQFVLHFYVRDMVAPAASVSLNDALAQGVVRPLNLAYRECDVVRVELCGPRSGLPAEWGKLEVRLLLS